jgi:hypothetical protein
MDKILNLDDTRYRDWCLWFRDLYSIKNDKIYEVINKYETLIPYDMLHLSKYMYISGAYWVAKKHIMLEFPLNEKLSWGESEDLDWSIRIRNKYAFNMNVNSTVQLLKYKDVVFLESTEKTIEILKNVE